ncbi:hypothetical protein J5N97_023953 [Dioscorea zingiberensis]|uniref:Uncharacterized protein n=1 Tax=Dioscorea zingiberensis TaxID=325984 RepID=A0A9D5H8B7_9LILI|nr:hypothetical protein J5N97_023953 [Dioscorea zingiberensis]
MEKPPVPKSKTNKILKILKGSTSFSISNNHFSPRGRRPENSKPFHNKGFSGPLVPMEARRKGESRSFDVREPTSPKVSCMGQIKLKKSNCSSRKVSDKDRIQKKNSFTLKKMFNTKVRPGRKTETPVVAPPPPVGQLRRFTSGRDWLADFDWKKAYEDSEEEEEEEVMVPHSAPILIGGGGVAPEPKKEVNLWKRRTIDPPKALQMEVK